MELCQARRDVGRIWGHSWGSPSLDRPQPWLCSLRTLGEGHMDTGGQGPTLSSSKVHARHAVSSITQGTEVWLKCQDQGMGVRGDCPERSTPYPQAMQPLHASHPSAVMGMGPSHGPQDEGRGRQLSYGSYTRDGRSLYWGDWSGSPPTSPQKGCSTWLQRCTAC